MGPEWCHILIVFQISPVDGTNLWAYVHSLPFKRIQESSIHIEDRCPGLLHHDVFRNIPDAGCNFWFNVTRISKLVQAL